MKISLLVLFLVNILYSSVELVIGEERIDRGIIFIFEGAVKDHVMPTFSTTYKDVYFAEICKATRN